MKKLIIAALMVTFSMASMAQSGTNSPYSQYGLGVLSDQTSGFNRGMNGLGYGFHEHNQVNFLNPASYASVDSLSFIFDAGISGQVTNFSEKGVKMNANNANIESSCTSVLVSVSVSFRSRMSDMIIRRRLMSGRLPMITRRPSIPTHIAVREVCIRFISVSDGCLSRALPSV